MIERLIHGRTHVCWTPDNDPSPEKVSLVRESDLMALEERLTRMEHALGAISGYENMDSLQWRKKYPDESARIRHAGDQVGVICDIAYEAVTK